MDKIQEVIKDCKTCRDLKLQHQKEGVDDGCKSSYCCMPLIEAVGKLQAENERLGKYEAFYKRTRKLWRVCDAVTFTTSLKQMLEEITPDINKEALAESEADAPKEEK